MTAGYSQNQYIVQDRSEYYDLTIDIENGTSNENSNRTSTICPKFYTVIKRYRTENDFRNPFQTLYRSAGFSHDPRARLTNICVETLGSTTNYFGYYELFEIKLSLRDAASTFTYTAKFLKCTRFPFRVVKTIY